MLHGRLRYRLQRRGRVWTYRRRVPADLRALLGRREIVRSLRGATTLRQARRLAALLDARVWETFDAIREGNVADGPDVDALVERLCDQYLRQLLAEDRADRREWQSDGDTRDAIDLGLGDAIEREAEHLGAGKTDHVRDDALALLKAAGQDLQGSALDALLWELVRTRLVALRKIRDEREGDAVGRPREPLHPAPVGAPAEPRAKSSPLLSKVIASYVEDHEGKTWAHRTGLMIKSALAEVLEILGDVPVGSITKEEVRRYRLTLDKLPANMSKRYPGRSIAEVLAESPEPGLSPNTIRKRLSYLIGLFRYAQRMEWIDRNPADGFRPPRARHVYSERDPFSDDDLRAIFGSDYRRGTIGKGNHARYWIPLVLLFTGARLEEIAQLETADVVEIEGVLCIKITARSMAAADGSGESPAAEGKRLKNPGSDRVVPIHSELTRLGFLGYVAERRREGDRRVFPGLSSAVGRGYGVTVSKWFTRWKRAHGITSRTKVLHSLRHTFATRLKEEDVQDHTISELMGHEVEGMTVGRYGKRLPVGRLRDAVELLDVREGLREVE